jgi:acetolactate synthase-1/2/3 large subunit
MKNEVTNSGAYFLARALKQHGVRYVFALCGDHINALYRAVALEGIQIVGTRSESAAVHMADAWARTSGEVGVVFVTGCPGHTNALTGMSVAKNAGSPVVIISGLTPPDQRERGGSQVLQQGELARPVTKWSLEVLNPTHIGEYITKAFQIATTGTPGSVSLSVPSDILEEVVVPGSDNPAEFVRDGVKRGLVSAVAAVPGETLEDIKGLLRQAKRPVLILGTGARWDRSAPVARQVVQSLGIPVFTIDQARGLVADDGVNCFGYADPFFSRTFREIIAADLIILAGAAIDFHTCFGRQQLISPDVRIIQIGQDPVLLNQCRQSNLSVLGPPVACLKAIADAWQSEPGKNKWDEWMNFIRKRYAENRECWNTMLQEVAQADSSIHPLQVCASLERHRTQDTGIIIDAGDFVHWPRGYFPASQPGRWMDAVLIGNLGGSVPLGVGSQMAYGRGQTWTFIGDGGFAFYSWDLEVAVQHKLPLKIILGNDACWGVEKRLQLAAYQEHIGCDLPEIRYDKFADMLGATGIYVDDVKDLDAAVDRLVKSEGPALLNVRIRSMAGRPLADFKRY